MMFANRMAGPGGRDDKVILEFADRIPSKIAGDFLGRSSRMFLFADD